MTTYQETGEQRVLRLLDRINSATSSDALWSAVNAAIQAAEKSFYSLGPHPSGWVLTFPDGLVMAQGIGGGFYATTADFLRKAGSDGWLPSPS